MYLQLVCVAEWCSDWLVSANYGVLSTNAIKTICHSWLFSNTQSCCRCCFSFSCLSSVVFIDTLQPSLPASSRAKRRPTGCASWRPIAAFVQKQSKSLKSWNCWIIKSWYIWNRPCRQWVDSGTLSTLCQSVHLQRHTHTQAQLEWLTHTYRFSRYNYKQFCLSKLTGFYQLVATKQFEVLTDDAFYQSFASLFSFY